VVIRTSPFVLVATILATPAAAASSGEASPSADELAARRRGFEENLRARGLVRAGDRVLPRVRARSLAIPDPAAHGVGWTEPPHHATIYLNFDGGTLRGGTVAAELESPCVGAAELEYPAFAGDDAARMAMVQVFENAMAPYAVRIAHEEPPPAHLPYSMVMMGGSSTDLGMEPGILGVSCSSDCGDVWWRDTTFAFTESSSSATLLGNTALQEAAHAFGLDHIDGPEHIMYPLATSGTKSWATECTRNNDSTGGIGCGYVHDVFCGEDSQMQNDHAELLAYFGPDEPDVVAPSVTVLSPPDGTRLPAGGSITIEADVTDDREGFGWRLVLREDAGLEQIDNAYERQTSWYLAGLPDGTYTVRIEAIDHDRNEASDEIRIVVGTGIGTPPPMPEDDTSSGSSDSSSSGDASGDGTGGVAAAGGGGDGCACGITAPSAGPLGLLACACCWLGRRRRR
jgi:hypothetical protein